MDVEQSRRNSRAVAINMSVSETRRRLAERMLIAAAVGTALVQAAWLAQAILRAAHP